ncbi:MAG: DUF2934 domain-containing protein [Acidobacteriota bacterium]|nr:DUF2934 domain-containing protein [Acidobacteriota bacterium]
MAETVKKPTTPRKPRATASAATPAAPKKTAAPKKKTATRKAKVVSISVTHEQIAALAHRYFEERGYAHGHDADDWLRAEAELLGKAS